VIAPLAQPPYYAVIFTSLRTEGDDGYAEAAARMDELAKQQPGYLGIDSARSGVGITVSYWLNLESVRAWKKQVEHAEVQRRGRERWYDGYTVRVCRVEYEYEFSRLAVAEPTP
jgi:heme-degrading monooxygenase HmoA